MYHRQTFTIAVTSFNEINRNIVTANVDDDDDADDNDAIYDDDDDDDDAEDDSRAAREAGCGGGVQRREATCVRADGRALHPAQCAHAPMPTLVQPCEV